MLKSELSESLKLLERLPQIFAGLRISLCDALREMYLNRTPMLVYRQSNLKSSI